MDFFDLFNMILLFIKRLYDYYLTITHPPLKFQANTLSFGWVSEIVTVGLSPIFHPISPCLQHHGLT
jgi:hypothetical protein